MTIGLLVQRAAARFGDRRAVQGPDGARTFAELAGRASGLARGLLSLGLSPGDRVLELLPNGCALVESDLALAMAGLVRVPLNPRLGPAEWERIADDCGARALIYDARFAEDTEALRSGLQAVVSGDAPGRRLDDLVTGGPVPIGVLPDDLVGLAYSSGTTGRPKGARRTHRNRIASALAMTHEVLGGPPAADAVYLHAGPAIHTSGLFVLPWLMAGAPQVFLDHADAATILAAVEEHRVTHTALVPTMVSRLAEAADGTPLRMLAYAGAPMPPGQIRRASERLTPHLVQYYGLVEAMPPLTVLDADDHARGLAGEPGLLTSAGRVCLAIDLRVVDEEGRPLPDGEQGEVVVRGDPVTPGYHNAEGRADLGKGFTNGWLRTGDIGHLGPGGRLWLTDRRNDMIITGGYNVYPREIEDVIAGVDGVAEAAVVGLADGEWGQRVAAVYTCLAGRRIEPDEVLRRCRAALPAHKRPKSALSVTSLPLNATGKISRREVLRRMEAGERW
ncbi:class I adenylate-forming enzyme family protein [Nonomuraea muscovyensis]|uniref:Acyl-CoA synthetase (AMP-forming)/AMP-acid ligase II n=1 Tax=Nonomuraea muscovyensis TaxID=1124761 RepID=A0A7X0EXX8_9ACTN|nr:AMP-binding protein [Nonomuraea muscovyensis]MBB6345844.1 acyl-CoA synthetase (AMP-forming)/AMP-acid ligase II [Nonomuraea muscovyensis]